MNIYNHVVKVGNTLYIAGQVPRSLDGKAAGGTLADIVKTTTYVVGADTGAKIRPARLEILPAEGRPTSTTVVVAGLADPALLVEVEAIAVIGDN